MAVSSMTGFGSAERAWRRQEGATPLRVVVEVRSVNARFLELKVRQPFGPTAEAGVRKQLERVLGRGRVELKISLERGETGSTDGVAAPENAPSALPTLGVDPARVTDVFRALGEVERLARGHAIVAPTSLEVLMFCLSRPGDKDQELTAPSWLDAVIDEALSALVAMREAEGEALAGVIAGHLDELEVARTTLARLVAGEGPRLTTAIRERLQAVAQQLGGAVDPDRVATEVAALLVRGDVAEELDRIDSHLAQARGVLSAPAARGQGKTLDFLSQELLREFTTVGSKVTHHEASARVIEAKGVIERLREQVQNVE